jgi:hypothetical protein
MTKLQPPKELAYTSPVEAMSKRFKMLDTLGWGEFNVELLNLDEGIIKISGNNMIVDSEDSIIAYFMRGALVGALGMVLKREFIVEMEYMSPGNLLFTLTSDNNTTPGNIHPASQGKEH